MMDWCVRNDSLKGAQKVAQVCSLPVCPWWRLAAHCHVLQITVAYNIKVDVFFFNQLMRIFSNMNDVAGAWGVYYRMVGMDKARPCVWRCTHGELRVSESLVLSRAYSRGGSAARHTHTHHATNGAPDAAAS